MLGCDKVEASPSRTYVAICCKSHFTGFYFRAFMLPPNVENTATSATRYFLQQNYLACISNVIPMHQYRDMKADTYCQEDLCTTC